MSEIIELYDMAKENVENNKCFEHYRELKKILKEKVECDEDKIKAYKMACKDRMTLDFNILISGPILSLGSLFFSLCSFANEFGWISLDGQDVFKMSLVIVVAVVVIGSWSIWRHKRERKYKEVLFVLEDIENEINNIC